MVICMWIKRLCAAALSLSMMVLPVAGEDRGLAPTPPMGWNSWDSYGLTVNEGQFRANMEVLAAQLKEFGWQYVVVDEGWYLENPETADVPANLRYTFNAKGQYEPAVNRFPSAKGEAGFKTLSDAAHTDGLKFGIHIIRGIPKKTAMADTRIGTTRFRASLAANTKDVCPWNPDNFGVNDNAAGQAWYDALMKQYASWGVDYIKVDCISSHPYRGDEIRMIHKAIGRSGREMVLSLSPGPTSLIHAEEVSKNAQMWRISEDVWDLWKSDSEKDFPQGVLGQFGLLVGWAKYAKAGTWPDADMLPIGQLRPNPGWGKARASRLTTDEQRTMITLWAMARSPLFIGGNLTQMDEEMKVLLTNPGVIAVDQHSAGAHPLESDGDVAVWTSESTTDGAHYVAIFNTGDAPAHINKSFSEFGFVGRAQYNVRDVWQRKELGVMNAFTVDLVPHGVVLLSIRE
jgi:alpha-galactosidase